MLPVSHAHTRHAETRAILEISAVLALTGLHHPYGAIHSATPWRYHTVFLSSVVWAVILIALVLSRAKPHTTAGHLARWVFWVVSVRGPVLLIGSFEGCYNQRVNNALYFGGLPEARIRSLFPPPYEMPSDLLCEATDILQVFLAGMAAYHLIGLIPQWPQRREGGRQ
jgi:hypothetical protein